MIVGLTGKSCCGKDTLAAMLPSDSFEVIDEDKIGHLAHKELLPELLEAFGNDILNQDGQIDRKKLGAKVFSDKSELDRLNAIVHPWMVEYTIKRCKEIENEGRIAVINAALLEKMGFVQYCSVVVLVLSSYEHRLERALKRDGIDEEGFYKRSKSQEDIGRTLFSSGKQVITIFNNDSKEQLSRQVKYLCGILIK